MGSCEIGYFACGRGAVDLGEHAQLSPFLAPCKHGPAAKPAAGLSDDQTAGFFLWEGNLMTTTSRDEPPPDAPCPCGHTADEHDSVASRYCLATANGALGRDCMCVPVSTRFSYDGVAR
jgi:hypothetical protein